MPRLLIFLFSFGLVFKAWALNNSKAIYGEDNRSDTIAYKNREFRQLAKAISIQIPKRRMLKNGSKYWFEAETFQQEQNVCTSVPFSQEKVLGDCSGFLIAQDLLVTAGHCLEKGSSCESYLWAFDFNKNKLNRGYLNLSEVYSCKRVVDKMVDSFEKIDFAVIQLDRPVMEAEPLKLGTGNLMVYSPLFIIGHPNGVSAKIAQNGKVLESGSDQYTFKSDVDAFVVNSGSPVFNGNTKKVEGILIRGIQDFTYNRFEQCYELNVCKEPYNSNCQGETVLKSSVFDQYLNQ